MKKIGIVTWYDRGFNYGSTLQAYSTQTYLKKLGYNCELINYKPDNKNKKKKIKEILKIMYLIVFKHKVYKKWKKMRIWIKKYIHESELIVDYEKLKESAKKYDALICGSDQIWNNAKNIIDPFNYLQFVDKAKRIAYAPSIARDYIPKEVEMEFKQYVKEIKHLSVREEKGAELIKECTGIEAKVVIDPTFLINKDIWEKNLPITDRIIDEPYMFVYFLSKNEKNYREVEKIAKDKNLKIVSTPMIYDNNKVAIEADCTDFLNLIKNAKYIATDSFHGVAFSIILEKDFAVFKRFKDNFKQTQNSRIYNILEKLNLNNRLVTDENKISDIIKKDIDYKSVKEKLNIIVDDSKKYLISALENVTKD